MDRTPAQVHRPEAEWRAVLVPDLDHQVGGWRECFDAECEVRGNRLTRDRQTIDRALGQAELVSDGVRHLHGQHLHLSGEQRLGRLELDRGELKVSRRQPHLESGDARDRFDAGDVGGARFDRGGSKRAMHARTGECHGRGTPVINAHAQPAPGPWGQGKMQLGRARLAKHRCRRRQRRPGFTVVGTVHRCRLQEVHGGGIQRHPLDRGIARRLDHQDRLTFRQRGLEGAGEFDGRPRWGDAFNSIGLLIPRAIQDPQILEVRSRGPQRCGRQRELDGADLGHGQRLDELPIRHAHGGGDACGEEAAEPGSGQEAEPQWKSYHVFVGSERDDSVLPETPVAAAGPGAPRPGKPKNL